MENRKCWCPVTGREITALDCLDAALVYEGISPPAELPVGMEDTKQNRETCMNCPNPPNRECVFPFPSCQGEYAVILLC